MCWGEAHQRTGEAKTGAVTLGESKKLGGGGQKSRTALDVNSTRAGSRLPSSNAGGWEQIPHTTGSDAPQLCPVLPHPAGDTQP